MALRAPTSHRDRNEIRGPKRRATRADGIDSYPRTGWCILPKTGAAAQKTSGKIVARNRTSRTRSQPGAPASRVRRETPPPRRYRIANFSTACGENLDAVAGSRSRPLAGVIHKRGQSRPLLCARGAQPHASFALGKAHAPVRRNSQCGYYQLSELSSGITAFMPVMATSIIESSGSNTVRCWIISPGQRSARDTMLSERPA